MNIQLQYPTKQFMPLSVSSYHSLPQRPGVYLFLSKNNKVLYVGKAKNLKKRVSSYFVNRANLLEKTRILVSQIKKIRYVIADSEIEALLLEANCIKKYMPKYNARFRDGKRYPLIRITIKDKYPKVLVARRYEDDPSDKESLYFGPFPNSSALRLVLRTLRRIFPYQSVVNHPKKQCLYYHLDLCPCPEALDAKEYKENIKHLIDFLNGKTKKVIKNLKAQRDHYSKLEEFEKASLEQKKVDAILYITSPVYQKFDYRVNPNLETDLRNKELASLKDCLNRHNTQINKLDRIECYDISNISGKNATGSMVVFLNGEKDPSQYRRFRIKNLPNFPNLPNDFAMMQQVISRRLSHKEWKMPDLIIVDGGKGHVSAAMKALYSSSDQAKPESREASKKNSSRQARTINRIPVIGLAKREEVIITSAFKQIMLPRSSEALKLIMRIRDEAHRFAVSYHRKLRSKALFSTNLVRVWKK